MERVRAQKELKQNFLTLRKPWFLQAPVKEDHAFSLFEESQETGFRSPFRLQRRPATICYIGLFCVLITGKLEVVKYIDSGNLVYALTRADQKHVCFCRKRNIGLYGIMEEEQVCTRRTWEPSAKCHPVIGHLKKECALLPRLSRQREVSQFLDGKTGTSYDFST